MTTLFMSSFPLFLSLPVKSIYKYQSIFYASKVSPEKYDKFQMVKENFSFHRQNLPVNYLSQVTFSVTFLLFIETKCLF